jgi:excisionase family DNA binding protein
METATMEDFVSAKDAAEILGVTIYTLYRWRKRGWIDAITLPNGTIRIPRAALDRLLHKEALNNGLIQIGQTGE